MQIQMRKGLKKKKRINWNDSKYYDTEKQSNFDLENSQNKLDSEINKVKQLIKENMNNEALIAIEEFKKIINFYAESYSKNQNIKIY